jgi:hypothetical protein
LQGGQGGVGQTATQGGQGGVGQTATEGTFAIPLIASAATNTTNRIELFLILGYFLFYRRISGDVDINASRSEKGRSAKVS